MAQRGTVCTKVPTSVKVTNRIYFLQCLDCIYNTRSAIKSRNETNWTAVCGCRMFANKIK